MFIHNPFVPAVTLILFIAFVDALGRGRDSHDEAKYRSNSTTSPLVSFKKNVENERHSANRGSNINLSQQGRVNASNRNINLQDRSQDLSQNYNDLNTDKANYQDDSLEDEEQDQASNHQPYQQVQRDNDQRVPIWNLAHMVNAIDEIDKVLARGANGIEADIKFETDGTPTRTYHGFPCDCLRHCERNAPFDLYLDRISELTTTRTPSKMIVLLLDLKLKPLNESVKRTAGYKLAKVVVEHLLVTRRGRSSVKLIVSINHVKDEQVVRGFYDYLEENNHQELISRIGWDIGMNDDLNEVSKMWLRLGEQLPVYNIWQGDGLTNCVSPVINSRRLKNALEERERGRYLNKVYRWTIDLHEHIRDSLRRDLDSILTNHPERVVEVLKEKEFSPFLRLAEPSDDPFELITGHRLDGHKVKRNVQKTSNTKRLKSFLSDIKDSVVNYVAEIPKSIFTNKRTGTSRV